MKVDNLVCLDEYIIHLEDKEVETGYNGSRYIQISGKEARGLITELQRAIKDMEKDEKNLLAWCEREREKDIEMMGEDDSWHENMTDSCDPCHDGVCRNCGGCTGVPF